jgi:hypothetical protein
LIHGGLSGFIALQFNHIGFIIGKHPNTEASLVLLAALDEAQLTRSRYLFLPLYRKKRDSGLQRQFSRDEIS